MSTMVTKKSNLATKIVYDTFVPHIDNGGHPHVFHHGTLVVVAIIAISVVVSIFSLTDKQDHTRLAADVYSGLLVDLTNEDRIEKNLPTLAKNNKLALAAQYKAEDMATKGYFAHTSPEGLSSWYWFGKVGYNFSYAGENLAVDFTESKDVSDAWMNSPTHRANILNSGFTEIGIATHDGMYKGDKSTFVVQMFGTPVKAFAEMPQVAPIVQTKKSEPIEKTSATPQKNQLVLGETSVVATSGDETNSMVVIKNESPTISSESESVTPVVVEKYTPWYQKLLIELSRPLGITLVIIGSMIGISFILSVIYHKTILKKAALGALIAFVIIFSGFVYISIAHDMSVLLSIRDGLINTIQL